MSKAIYMFTYTYAKYSTSDAAKYSTSDQLSLKIAEAGPGHIRISSNSIKFTLESERVFLHTNWKHPFSKLLDIHWLKLIMTEYVYMYTD